MQYSGCLEPAQALVTRCEKQSSWISSHTTDGVADVWVRIIGEGHALSVGHDFPGLFGHRVSAAGVGRDLRSLSDFLAALPSATGVSESLAEEKTISAKV